MQVIYKSGLEINMRDIKKIDVNQYRYFNTRTNEVVTTIQVNKEKMRYAIPRNYKKFLNALKGVSEEDLKIKDFRIEKGMEKPFVLDESFKLRDYQKKAVNNIIKMLKETKENACILQAKTGSGKTYQLPAVVKALGQKTLILVDRLNLVEQMYKEFRQNVKEGAIQVLTSKTNRIADVNISTIQLLLQNKSLLKRLQKEIGFVVVDECHIVSIGAFTDIITSFSAKYRLGMSATPTRSDGLTQALYDHFGFNKVIGDNPNLLNVRHIIVKHNKSIYYVGKTDANRVWRELYSNLELIEEVSDLAIKLYKEKNRAVFIYNTFQRSQELLKEMLNSKGYSVGIINAKTKKKEREEIIEKFNNRELDFIVSGVILQKGVSIYRLDTIINFANHTKESFEQAVGRLRREHKEKKQPLFVSFCWEGKGFFRCMQLFEWIERLKRNYKDELVVLSYDKFKSYIN